MTVTLKFGRRVPQSWFKRQVFKVQGLLTFQENLWQMLLQSFRMARRKALAESKPPIQFVITQDKERESLNYFLEWMTITIQGLPEQEKEEYEEGLRIYDGMTRYFKKNGGKDLDYTGNEQLKELFKTKMLDPKQLEKAIEAGKQNVSENNIASKLLEMGIISHIEYKDDYKERMATLPSQSI
jgi:hypothetical protein